MFAKKTGLTTGFFLLKAQGLFFGARIIECLAHQEPEKERPKCP